MPAITERPKLSREVRRVPGHLELRAVHDDGHLFEVEGFACVTESPYAMRDMFGEYEEVVRAGAFAKTLAEKADVRFLYDHEGMPLARTKSGTLLLDEVMSGETLGLHVVATLDSRSTIAADLRLAMERGDVDEMSFAFRVTRQQWSPDYTQRDITEVELFDVSAVTYPANPATSIGLRSLEALDALSDEEAAVVLARLQQRRASGMSLAHARAIAASLA